MLARLCVEHGARLVVLPGIPQDARETERTLDLADVKGADYVLVLHGGLTMGVLHGLRYRVGITSVSSRCQNRCGRAMCS